MPWPRREALWVPTRQDEADTPSRWDEAVGTLHLRVFPGCSSSCYRGSVLSEQPSLSRQDRGMMPLRRQRTAIYKQFCWQLPRPGRKTARKRDLRVFGRKVPLPGGFPPGDWWPPRSWMGVSSSAPGTPAAGAQGRLEMPTGAWGSPVPAAGDGAALAGATMEERALRFHL